VGEDATQDTGLTRVSVGDAADRLGTTVDAIRKRVQRDTIAYDKDESGRVWITLDADRTRQGTGQDTTGHRQDSESGVLISEMRDRIASLEHQLEQERQANSEHRRLLAAALERIPPQIEPPESPESEASPGPSDTPTEAPAEPQEGVQRPWWRRMFGG
jgi:hypothetical protein